MFRNVILSDRSACTFRSIIVDGFEVARRIRVARVPAMKRSPAWVLCVLLVAAGCETARTASEGPMEEALAAVKGGGGSPRERALAGWHRYLVDGDSKNAAELFTSGQDDLVALAGRMELARRDLAVEERAKLAIRLATLGANHPLGRVAAHTMVDLLGESPQLDAMLAEGAQKILQQKAEPGVAFLCRVAVARAAEQKGDPGWKARFAEAGAIHTYAVAGPLGALPTLDFGKAFAPEQEHALRESYATPVGNVRTRNLEFPAGDIHLYGEPDRGAIYYLASDFTAQGGNYVVHSLGTTAHELWVDGQRVIAREPSSLEGSQYATPVLLSAGPHRLLLKVSRANGAPVSVFVVRGDGAAEDLHPHPSSGPAPAGSATLAENGAPTIPVRAKDLYAQLAPELGNLAARYVAARDALPRDLEGTKELLAGINPYPETGPMLVLRAQVTLSDRSLPDRIAKGRAGRDLEVATEKDARDAAAWLLRSGQAREGERFDDAQLFLTKAEGVAPSALVSLNQARLALARGLDALADTQARRAVELFPGYCDALELRYDVARRREDVNGAENLAKALSSCPEGLERAAEFARSRSDLASAERLEAARLDRVPSNWRVAADLSQVLVAAKRYADAEKVLADQLPLWPRNAELHKRLAEVLTLAGDGTRALAEKRASLALDGSDLGLRRQLALAEGHDLLDEFAVDDKKVIAEWEKAPKGDISSAASAYVLDLAGVQILPDGTELERIHTIAQVLDQRGIPQLAEQHLPSGAIPLKLQTIKKNGRVLEPEALGDKEGVSLPSVQVGDYVDIEYLQATPPRPASQPGWSSVPFYFRIAESPLFRSTYTVKAPADQAVAVDAHNMKAPTPKKEGDQWVVHYEAHQVPLFIPEPNAPGGREYLPFMQVGTGAGPADVLWPFADALADHDQPTLEVQQWARAVVGEKTGVEAVKAVFAAASEKVKGDENDINERASTTLARERGSRLWLIKGALRVLGIPAHLALVRPLAADPAPYLFPNTDLYTYPVLLVEVPEAAPIWLDPSVRFGPFDELPEQVAGEREAVVLPEAGEGLRMVKTPPARPDQPKSVKLRLAIDALGNVTGEGEETYSGFDAAFLRSGLERYDEQQRKQAVEVALSRSFHGAALEKLDVAAPQQVGAPLTLSYRFISPHFARSEPGRLVFNTSIFPLALGQRYVSLANRTTPLLINGNESSVTEVRMELPAGMKAVDLGQPANITGPFGTFKRAAKLEGNTLVLDEYAEVKQGRVSPESYADFVRFTAAVDQAQQQPMVVGQ